MLFKFTPIYKRKVASLTIDPRSVPRPVKPRNLLKPECRHCVHNVKQSSRKFCWGEGELRDLSERNRGRCMSFKITNGSFSSGSRNFNHRQTQGFFVTGQFWKVCFFRINLTRWPLTLPVIHVVITPKNGPTNGQLGLFHPHKWSYNLGHYL